MCFACRVADFGDLRDRRDRKRRAGRVAVFAVVIRQNFGGDETTGIKEIYDSQFNASGIYTMDGRRIEGQPIRKGVYIVRSAKGRLQGKNGKKTVIK